MIRTEAFNQNVSVIIRTVGERTEKVCRELVLAQGISEENIILINKTPFTIALKASYEAGIVLNRPWTFCVDADVLLLPGSIQKMLDIARMQEPNVLEIQGQVLDKFFGGPREAGNHFYRTSLLGIALEHIPINGNVIRPEFHALEVMRSKGYPWHEVNCLVGIHDFEQYYRDIFRKCFVHARKHLYLSELFLTYWPQELKKEMDYKVALQGFIEGIQFEGEVGIDAEQAIFRDSFEKLQIDEKPGLPPGSIAPSDIEDLVNSWIEPPVYRLYFSYGNADPDKQDGNTKTWQQKLMGKKDSLGFFKLILFIIGWGLEKAGTTIKKLVDPQKMN